MASLRDSTPVVLTPAGFAEDGTESEAAPSMLYETDIVRLDASHASDGYILVTYKGTNEKVKFQIQAPDGITYTYLVSETGSAIVLQVAHVLLHLFRIYNHMFRNIFVHK